MRVKSICKVPEKVIEIDGPCTYEERTITLQVAACKHLLSRACVTGYSDMTRGIWVALTGFSSVHLCDPMDCSTPGLLVHHQLLEFTQNSCPLSQQCHPAISSSVVPFSHLQPFPASRLFQMSQFSQARRGLLCISDVSWYGKRQKLSVRNPAMRKKRT